MAALVAVLLAGMPIGLTAAKNKDKSSDPAKAEKLKKHEGNLEVGQEAPDFTLKGLDGKEVALSSFRGQKPVFLIFGSYT